MNRSIQAEGAFGEIKGNMGFWRFLSFGCRNVLVEIMLLVMGHNTSKLHHKIQAGHAGRYLFPVTGVAEEKQNQERTKTTALLTVCFCALFFPRGQISVDKFSIVDCYSQNKGLPLKRKLLHATPHSLYEKGRLLK